MKLVLVRLGTFFGAIIGNISKALIGFSLSFAAGAMLYIISCEIIPESKKMYSGRISSIGNVLRNYNRVNNKINIIEIFQSIITLFKYCFYLF